MNRPYIFCHMMTSLDGKIMGNYMDTKEGERAGNRFYDIAFGTEPYYRHQGWLSGRVTTDDNFTFYRRPDIDGSAAPVPDGDFITQTGAPMYYVSIDPKGVLGWESGTLKYGDVTAQVIEVLTERADNSYKALLRKLGIPYIIAGKERLDCPVLLEKLCTIFPIKTLMLGGGGVLNWSFIQAGLCDELSLVIAPAADGSIKTPSLFAAKERLTEDRAVGFALQNADAAPDGSVWLRYLVKNCRTDKKDA